MDKKKDNRLAWIVAAGLVAAMLSYPVSRLGRLPDLKVEMTAEARDHEAFGQIPGLLGGRIQPLDTIARNALLFVHGKRTYKGPASYEGSEKEELSAIEWLEEVFYNPAKSAKRPIFRAYHPQVRSAFGHENTLDGGDRTERYFLSFDEILSNWKAIEDIMQMAPPSKEVVYSDFQEQMRILSQKVIVYLKLRHSMHPIRYPGGEAAPKEIFANPDAFADVAGKLGVLFQKLDDRTLLEEDPSAEERQVFIEYQRTGTGYFRPIPVSGEGGDDASQLTPEELENIQPPGGWLAKFNKAIAHSVGRSDRVEESGVEWVTLGEGFLASLAEKNLREPMQYFARIGDAHSSGDNMAFNSAVDDLLKWFQVNHPRVMEKTSVETKHNYFAPFKVSLVFYLVASILVMVGWMVWGVPLRWAAWAIMAAGLFIHTGGIMTRMELEGRPPITNLYSSAVFVGWGCIFLALIIELLFGIPKMKKILGDLYGLILVAAGMTGVMTLIIADQFAMKGDTLEVLQAVLDINFWLATHVIIVNFGYVGTLLAGFVAIMYLIGNLLMKLGGRGGLAKETRRNLKGVVYGVICFATLMSLIGTILGGIWADQSWGRFWGWDPKENGALIVVLWNALILHARWGGMVKERGLMVLAVLGNIGVIWAWFGTNLLDFGLHSYGGATADSFPNWTHHNLFILAMIVLSFLGFVKPGSAKKVEAPPAGGKAAGAAA